jgi:hypothetical protein
MLRRVPSSLGDIEAADKGDGIVHNHYFLMVRAAEGVAAVQMKMEPPMGAEAEFEERQRLTFEGVDHCEIPGKYIRVK